MNNLNKNLPTMLVVMVWAYPWACVTFTDRSKVSDEHFYFEVYFYLVFSLFVTAIVVAILNANKNQEK